MPDPQNNPQNNPQNVAADPGASAFLTANAGSGKTSTLVNRVARLLLNGAKPERILCVTYTKAAAAEMQGRLFEHLGGWAVADDKALAKDLIEIGEATHDLARARALFASALETPGGLKIQTLHAFCEKLLRRFPLEAGLSPAFQVMDDLKGRALAQAATDALLTLSEPEGLTEARDRLIRKLKVSGFERLLAQFVIQHDTIAAALNRFRVSHGSALAQAIYASLGLEETLAPEMIVARFEAELHWPSIADLANSMSNTDGANNKKTGAKLLAVIEASRNGAFDLHLYYKCFYTDKDTFSDHTYSGKASESDKQHLHRLAEAVAEVVARKKAAEVAQNTLDAIILFLEFSEIYQTLKQREGVLDFQDLINRAKGLLADSDMSIWVLFKLDGGLEHILVDEAQDTSDDQWEIVKALSGEFFSGRGQGAEERTVFAVGDEKQSIYGFQGARPDRFIEAGRYFDGLVRGAGQKFVAPDLIDSWRTLPELLGFVDAVFPAPDLAHALNFTGNLIQHRARRSGPHGFVELWPLVQPIDAPDASADDLDIAPVDQPNSEPAAKRLARQIASVVRAEIQAGRAVYEKKSEAARPLHAGDVLILVRKRDALFEHIIRELKMAGVAVSGADRLKLGDHIAFQDLRALLRFCLRPEDDLSLACCLRSPLCDLDEDDLYQLAQGREGALWSALRHYPEETGRFAEARALLGWALRLSRGLSAFDFLARVLNRRDMAGRSMKQRFLTRLGDECEDVLDETLGLALQGETAGESGLVACLDLFEFRAAQIKREQEEGGRAVRVMTVHGSKGLEAPWVILPIGPQHTSASKDDLLMLGEEGDIFLSASRKGDVQAISALRDAKTMRDEQEGLRLLYVALTRARDRLTLCGFAGKKTPKPGQFGAWYDLLDQAFDRLPEAGSESMALQRPFDDMEMTDKAVIRTFGQRAPALTPEAERRTEAVILPDFALADVAQAEVDLERWRAISQMGDDEREEDERAPSPLSRQKGLGRYRRGELIHKLFEILPEVTPERRGDVAARYLGRQDDLDAAQRTEMAGAVLAVLDHPHFTEAFGPNSRPEVALAGQIGVNASGEAVKVSGRIDRLVITKDRVLIIDYKSNRPAPDRAEDASKTYQRQMAGYVALLRRIHPDKMVEAALLWTDGPRLTPLSEALVNLSLAEILAR
ncbi:double-strand break repair helicase AddA [Asticcacaulis sp. EMRT-3]|uniref:double-strand break repair helicase AddA n=1 Tax=Asticcacaulis sp. EMRT-3 TaxID=3040349 RepID=UPI0024AF2CC6|nr:double-strand break repair helicase AddA [Asticcacaulis sp. EMRT-3]MDI7775888.1 double-strand break repair helicase AddA [Asticcacaulis sp. EMRT-3]